MFTSVLTALLGYRNLTYVAYANSRIAERDIRDGLINISISPSYVVKPNLVFSVDISHPIAAVRRGLIHSKAKGNFRNGFSLLPGPFQPFKKEVWLTIILSKIVINLLDYVFGKFGAKKQQKALKFLFGLEVFILFRFYRTLFFGTLFLNQENRPLFQSFAEFSELFEQNRAHYVTHRYASSGLRILNTSSGEDYLRIQKNFQKNPVVKVRNAEELVENLRENPSYAHGRSSSWYNYMTLNYCELIFTEITQETRFLHVLIQKRTKLSEEFNRVLYFKDLSFLDVNDNVVNGYIPTKRCPKKSYNPKENPISLTAFAPNIVFYFIGLSIACVWFCFEFSVCCKK